MAGLDLFSEIRNCQSRKFDEDMSAKFFYDFLNSDWPKSDQMKRGNSIVHVWQQVCLYSTLAWADGERSPNTEERN